MKKAIIRVGTCDVKVYYNEENNPDLNGMYSITDILSWMGTESDGINVISHMTEDKSKQARYYFGDDDFFAPIVKVDPGDGFTVNYGSRW